MATGISKNQWTEVLVDDLIDHESCENKGVEPRLFYKGKTSEDEILRTKPANVYLLWNDNDNYKAASKNRLYFGDNLPILASLLNDSSVIGKVKLIYIDPPFATGGIFQSRKQVNAYQDILTGPSYLEFLRRRLVILRELLAEDGSIYIHLDNKMAFHVKIIMDEVFGQRNFRNWITRKKCNPKNYTRKTYGNISDYILFYTKSSNYVWNRPYEYWTEERAVKEYNYIDEGTGRRYKKVPIHAPGVRRGETGKPWRGKYPPPGKHWQFPPKTLDEIDARGEIYWSPTGNPRRKIYLDQSLGVPIQDIWLEFRDAHNQNIKITGYPTEKNPDLLNRIIEASSNPKDLVLDCFSGSGTTLSVASFMGRNWIGIDNSTEAIATNLRRFAIGLKPMGDFVNNKSEKQRFKNKDLFEYMNVINNFSLCVTDTYSGELENILAQWIKWQDELNL